MAELYKSDLEDVVEKMHILKCKQNEAVAYSSFRKEISSSKNRLKLKHSRGKENNVQSNTDKVEKHSNENNSRHRKSSDVPFFKKEAYGNSKQEMIFQNTSIISPCADGEVYSILEDVGIPLVESTRIHSSQSFALLNLSMSEKSSDTNKVRPKDLKRMSELYVTAVETQNDYYTVMDGGSQIDEISSSNTDYSENSATMEGSFCEVRDTSVQTDSPLRNDSHSSENHSPKDVSSSTIQPNVFQQNCKNRDLMHSNVAKHKPQTSCVQNNFRGDNTASENLLSYDSSSPLQYSKHKKTATSPDDSRTVVSDSEDEYGTPEASPPSSVDNRPAFNKYSHSNKTHMLSQRNMDMLVPDSDEDDESTTTDMQKFDFSNIGGIHVNYFCGNNSEDMGVTVQDSPDVLSSPHFSNNNSSKSTPTCVKSSVPNQCDTNSLRAKFLKQKILKPANSDFDEVTSSPDKQIKINTGHMKSKVKNSSDEGLISSDDSLSPLCVTDPRSKSPVFKSSKGNDILLIASIDSGGEMGSHGLSEKHVDRNSDSDLYKFNTSLAESITDKHQIMNATCNLSDSDEEFKKNSLYFTPAISKTPKATLSDSDEDFDAPEPFLDTPSTPELDTSHFENKSDNSLVYTPIVPQELRPEAFDSNSCADLVPAETSASEVLQKFPSYVQMQKASLKSAYGFHQPECGEASISTSPVEEVTINTGPEEEASMNSCLGEEASINSGHEPTEFEEEPSDEEGSCCSGLEEEGAGLEEVASNDSGLREEKSINTGLKEEESIASESKEQSRYSVEPDEGSFPDSEMDRYKVIVAEPSNSWRKPSLNVSSDSDDDFEKFLAAERKPAKKESVKSSDSNDSLKDFIVDDDEVEDDESDDAGESDNGEQEDDESDDCHEEDEDDDEEEEEEGFEDEELKKDDEKDNEDENNEEEGDGDVSSCSDEEMFLVSSKSPRNLGCTVISPASKPSIVDFNTPLSHRLKLPNSLLHRTSPNTLSPVSTVNDDVFKTPNRPTMKVISSSVRAVSERKTSAKRTHSESTLCTKTHSFLASLSSGASDHKCHPDAIKYVKQFKKYHEELSKVLFKLYNETVFDLKLPEDMSIIWNKRLLRTAGYCAYKRVNGIHVSRVELSTKVCDTPERVRDTLIHELCHAAVWMINNQNDGHGPLWKYWARKANSCHRDLPVISRCHNYSITTKFTYACTQCGYQIGRHSKSLDTLRKLCGYCHGTFQLMETPGSKSGTPRTPNKFALFVKENYGSTKKSSSDLKHKDVMQLLSKQFAEKTRLESS